jgi:hypothetical protein
MKKVRARKFDEFRGLRPENSIELAIGTAVAFLSCHQRPLIEQKNKIT